MVGGGKWCRNGDYKSAHVPADGARVIYHYTISPSSSFKKNYRSVHWYSRDRPNFGIVGNQPNWTFRPFFVRNFCESSAEPNLYFHYVEIQYIVKVQLWKYNIVKVKLWKYNANCMFTILYFHTIVFSLKILAFLRLKNQEKSFEVWQFSLSETSAPNVCQKVRPKFGQTEYSVDP